MGFRLSGLAREQTLNDLFVSGEVEDEGLGKEKCQTGTLCVFLYTNSPRPRNCSTIEVMTGAAHSLH
jgi:hypothetical protein